MTIQAVARWMRNVEETDPSNNEPLVRPRRGFE
jgi:hypothetical protein